ncbi:PaaI family thioesterase [Burkholderia orbicola]|uniref:PaaI family thioesterase n=1 Tax=Burkholderia orbicola TaxID=2978683 RepID=UPI0039A6A465
MEIGGDVATADQAEIASAVRYLIRAATAIDAPANVLRRLARSIRMLADDMGPLPRCDYDAFQTLQLNHSYSPVGGKLNPLFPILEFEPDADDPLKLRGRIHPSFNYRGPPGLVHGGIVAAIHDQLVASVTRLHGHIAVTASLKVNYRLPTPIDQPLDLSAWIENCDGRKLSVRAICQHEGRTTSESEALLITIDPSYLEKRVRAD